MYSYDKEMKEEVRNELNMDSVHPFLKVMSAGKKESIKCYTLYLDHKRLQGV